MGCIEGEGGCCIERLTKTKVRMSTINDGEGMTKHWMVMDLGGGE